MYTHLYKHTHVYPIFIVTLFDTRHNSLRYPTNTVEDRAMHAWGQKRVGNRRGTAEPEACPDLRVRVCARKEKRREEKRI